MNKIILSFFTILYLCDFLINKLGINSKFFSMIPEFFSITIGLFTLFYYAINKQANIQFRYIFIFLFTLLNLAIGIIVNKVQPFAILSGFRIYFKFLPIFLLPLIWRQETEHIQKVLRLMLILGLMQVPIAIYQRFFEYDLTTGDYIAGTLTTAPMLTLYLVCVISLIIAFYLRKFINTKTMCIIVACLFLPTAINETKATIILLPLALFIPVIFESSILGQMKRNLTILFVSILSIVCFYNLYSYLYANKYNVIDFYSKGKVRSYLYKESVAANTTGEEGEVGRIDSIILAYKENSSDFFRLMWGVGIGNASKSFSRKFEGNYTNEYMRLGGKMTGIAHFLWELGLLGTFCLFLFILMIFLDAMKVRSFESIPGSLALGWLGVTSIFIISLPYQNIIAKNELIFPFLYFSGYIASVRYDAGMCDLGRDGCRHV